MESRKEAIERLKRESAAKELTSDPLPVAPEPTERERARQAERDAILIRPEPPSRGRVDGVEI
jgi:hypothetical protein